MRPAAVTAGLILAALLFVLTGVVVQREIAARYELTRGAAPLCSALVADGSQRCRNRVRPPETRCWRHRHAPRSVQWSRT
jgi:hypothetical protein